MTRLHTAAALLVIDLEGGVAQLAGARALDVAVRNSSLVRTHVAVPACVRATLA